MSTGTGLPARRGGAKALMLTVLGEFVLPAGGQAWTSSLVAAADALGIGEKNARQALARISDQGLIEGERHGRSVRWALTSSGRTLLETGTERIYTFGRSEVPWDGHWLTAHCPVAESRRAERNQLRTELGFLGFGELSASLVVSPHTEREAGLRDILSRLDLLADSTILRATSTHTSEDHQLVAKAWDLDQLTSSYRDFVAGYRRVENCGSAPSTFGTLVELVHDWRRFPFTDPELPTQLLPKPWVGAAAAELFHEQHERLCADAQGWFAERESRS